MSRRDQIRMTEAEVQAFLEEERTMAVATVGKDGRPHVVAMWYAFLDGDICFWTYAKSQKAVNLRRDPRITCMVDAGDAYEDLRGVELVARAHVTENPEELLRFGVTQFERYQGAPVSDETRPGVERMAAKRVLVRLEIERVVSWDHRKLGGAY